MTHAELEQSANWQLSHQQVKVLTGGTDKAIYFYGKRLMDVTIAILMLPLLLPLIALIAILIKLDSRGPVFFAQERVGARRRISMDGRITWEVRNFCFYKFRSMMHNADESLHEAHIKAFVQGTLDKSDSDGDSFKLHEDPRITRIGRILRNTSLDELPQLVNVLKGEMSLVGPRPVPTYEVDEYDAWHHIRLAAPPGITGLWQIEGRSQVSFQEMVQMDIEYIRHQSLGLDLKILLHTFLVIFSGRGAG